jgi:ribosomal protein L11 methyltransferase
MRGPSPFESATAIMKHPQPTTFSRPCEDLYIYLIKGVIGEDDEDLLGHHFLGTWIEEASSFLFFSRPSRGCVDGLLAARLDIQLEDEFHFAYEEWQGGGLEPIRIDPFLIVPPWLDTAPRPDRTTILLDPGVVFGNCHHPTTQACLKALSLAAQVNPLRRVFDLGTGTGILALAAARLGASEVVAVDLNPLCVKTAARNVELNGLTGIIRVLKARAEDVADEPADLIVANIHYEVIKGLLEKNAFRETANLIISGLMRSQYGDIAVRLKDVGFHLVREWDHDMIWYTVLAGR